MYDQGINIHVSSSNTESNLPLTQIHTLIAIKLPYLIYAKLHNKEEKVTKEIL